MPSEVILPRVDMDMATGKISRWLVDDGAPVRKGQPLFEIETDKAAMEIEAEASGTIHTLARAGSDDVAVGSVVAWIYREGERSDAPPEPKARAAPTPVADAPAPRACPVAIDEKVGRPRATPLARRLARERGLDVAGLTGTGPRGRVQAADVPAPAAAAFALAEVRTGLRDASTDAPSAREAVAGDGVVTLREGTGTPIVLLHGFGSEADAWRPFLQGYSGRPVLALDLPGHGARPLGAIADFESVVDAIEEALVASAVGAFHLVGHSLGGAVAVAVAARGALDLRSLLLLAPAGLGPEINGAFLDGYLAAASEASLGPWLRELVARSGAVTPAFVRATLKSRDAVLPAQRRLAAALFPDGTQAFSVRADLARLACPVRILFGGADRIVPSRHAKALPAMVALHRLPGVGHLPQIEAPEIVQAILAQMVGP